MLREFDNTPEMRMDVDENDKAYLITIDIPGVRKEDIEVSIEGNQIAISAEVKREKSTKDKDTKEIHSERYVGRVYRAFTLPHEVDNAKADARYESGVLSLTLPKKAPAKTNRLTIN
jgi:HSP20 family protein